MANGVRIHRPRRGEALERIGARERTAQALDIQILKEVAKGEF